MRALSVVRRARAVEGLRAALRWSARHDDGMAVSGLTLIVALAALVLLMAAVVPIMQLTANSDQGEDAADAAALAAAQRVRVLALDSVTGLAVGVSLASVLPASTGIGEAATYASRNGADLVPGTYSLDRGDGRVELRVALRDQGEVVEGDDGRTVRNGAAEVGVTLSSCRLEERAEIIGYEPPPEPSPTPTPSPEDPAATPTPTPSPTPPPPPVPIWGSSYRFLCDGYTGAWDRDRSDVLDAARAWLDARLEPRLVR